MKKWEKRASLNLVFILSLKRKKSLEVALLSDKKASQFSDVPLKIIKDNRYLIVYFILLIFTNALPGSDNSSRLKYVDITPVFKKDDISDKINYRPISIIPNLTKIYERFMQTQVYPYLNQLFSSVSVNSGKDLKLSIS